MTIRELWAKAHELRAQEVAAWRAGKHDECIALARQARAAEDAALAAERDALGSTTLEYQDDDEA